MKRLLLGSLAAAMFTAAIAAQGATQQQPPPPTAPPAAQQQPATPQTPASEVTLVGCVTQGTSASVFLFENAIDPTKKNDTPRTFKITSSGEELDFTQHLNHKVQLVGVAEAKMPAAPPPGGKVAEKDLPVFTAKAVSHLATTCSAAGQ